MHFKHFFISLRPRQWVKNFFVLAALIFARKFTNLNDLELSLFAFVVFCLVSSGIYLINDVIDYQKDQDHPLKKNRPIAAGKISKKTAVAMGAFFLILGLSASFYINFWFFLTLTGYIVLNIVYSFYLKNLVILDIICIALGFVLRVIAGAVIINVIFSPWLLLCTFFLTLFLAIGKRKNELLCLENNNSRQVLSDYSLGLLDQMNTIVLPSTLLTYTLYTFNSWHSQWLIITVPIVLYGLFRYLFIIDKKKVSNNGPTDDLLFDRPLQITAIIWVVVVLAILFKYK